VRLLALFLLAGHAASSVAALDTVDYEGNDLVVTTGTTVVLAGRYTNIGTFIVQEGAGIVTGYGSSGVPDSGGIVEIHAQRIEYAGRFRAWGGGYSGGGGGGGGGGATQSGTNTCDSGGGGSPGTTYYNFYDGVTMSRARGGQRGSHQGGDFLTPCSNLMNGMGGRGGDGDGLFGGLGALPDSSGSVVFGQAGGYRGMGINGDTSIDASVWMGSGGSGGAGAIGCLPGGPGTGRGGGAGGNGGGSLKLYASQSLVIRSTAQIFCDGNPGNSMSSPGCPEGTDGSNTTVGGPTVTTFPAPGAGGGILLHAPDAEELTIEPGALIRTVGGNFDTINGGTVKIFHGDLPAPDPATGGFTILAGRTFIAPRPIIPASMMVLE